MAELLPKLSAEAVVLVHLSRRTNLAYARKRLAEIVDSTEAQRLHFLMDHRNNRLRYEQQRADAEAQVAAQEAASKSN